MAWERVMRPIDLGGLGIHNPKVMGWALQMCWLWIEKTKPDRPRAGLVEPVQPNMAAMFAISVISNVGNGQNTLFLADSEWKRIGYASCTIINFCVHPRNLRVGGHRSLPLDMQRNGRCIGSE